MTAIDGRSECSTVRWDSDLCTVMVMLPLNNVETRVPLDPRVLNLSLLDLDVTVCVRCEVGLFGHLESFIGAGPRSHSWCVVSDVSGDPDVIIPGCGHGEENDPRWCVVGYGRCNASRDDVHAVYAGNALPGVSGSGFGGENVVWSLVCHFDHN